MFSGSGLGYLNITPSGINTDGALQCVTAEEMAEAKTKCRIGSLRGLGATYQALAPMTGRLAPVSPCDVVKMSICPTPKCIDEYTAGVVANCIAGGPVSPEVDCRSIVVGYLSTLPFCARPGALAPLPSCLSTEQVALRSYCQTTPNGANKPWNAICWMMKNDPAYWQDVLSRTECKHAPIVQDAPQRAPAPTPVRVPDLVPPPAPVAAASASGTMGVAGILALVAVAGGGYYLYRRYKK